MSVTDQRALISAELADINTCLPGVIVDYDGEFATVRPTLAKQLANGETLPAPIIARVPVCWPCGDINGAKALITVPLKPGDQVELRFSQRALDDWLGGLDGAPGDPRQFDLSDCIATPMLRPGRGMKADLINVSLEYGGGSLKIGPAGEIALVSPLVTIDTPMVIVSGDVVAGGISLRTHLHTGVVPGPATTGGPV